MNRHTVRADRGVRKGKFVKLKVKEGREKLANVTKNRFMLQKSYRDSFISEDWGRRIVELNTLGEELWCHKCDASLSLRYIEDVQQYGLACILRVRCTTCKVIHDVLSCKRHIVHKKRYNVNFKMAIAVTDSGIGMSQLNTILSCLNVPTISSPCLRDYEKLISPALIELALESCKVAIQKEKEMTQDEIIKEKSVQLDSQNISEAQDINSHGIDGEQIPITVSIDTAWMTRGTGRSHNSNTAHSALIGYRSKKVLSIATRNKYCRCIYKDVPEDHDCTINFKGSSKAMEPSMAVQLIVHNLLLKESQIIIGTLVGDDDSSTISAVRKASSTPIEKWSDMNHATKSLSNVLYSMKLPSNIVKYFKRCFSYAVKQNKNNPKELETAMKSIVPHAHGNHDTYGKWCRYQKETENFRHHGLPNGKPLNNLIIKEKLTKVFNRYANNAIKLAPCASTQKNESFNSVVTSKHPKSRFYGASESFITRVHSAVCQMNEGTSYLMKLNEKLSLSPGKNTIEFRAKKDIERLKQKNLSETTKFKNRRLFRKKERSKQTISVQRKEGITYQSNCGLISQDLEINYNCLELNATVKDVDLSIANYVFFDLETTCLDKMTDICQIAALCKGKSFNCYIVPNQEIHEKATEKTGLYVLNNQLFLNGQKLVTVSINVALKNFITYLKFFNYPVILVANNGHRFDFPIIIRHMIQNDLINEFGDCVAGLLDSLIIFKKSLPNRSKEGKNYSLENIVIDFIGLDAIRNAHNAICDVENLQNVIERIDIQLENYRSEIKNIQFYTERKAVLAAIKKNTESSDPLKPQVTTYIINKMAKSDINLSLLIKTLHESGKEGIKFLLGENINNKPRVTKSAKILRSLTAALMRINITN